MTYKHHLHLLSHLVTQHQKKEFSFTKHLSANKALKQEQKKQAAIALLQEQLAETRNVLVRMHKSLSNKQYQQVVNRIHALENKIKEKRKKLDL